VAARGISSPLFRAEKGREDCYSGNVHAQTTVTPPTPLSPFLKNCSIRSPQRPMIAPHFTGLEGQSWKDNKPRQIH